MNDSTTNSTIGVGWGYGAAGVAVLCFGSNFVPVKKFETGDGMFFQFVMCNGILFVGIIMNLIRRSTFHPFVMVGGAMWATGNICVVPIIKTIGLGLGILIWATVNSLAGWACGRFGFFGLTPEVPPKEALNYVGVALCAVSGVLYMFVKSDVSTKQDVRTDSPEVSLTNPNDDETSPMGGDFNMTDQVQIKDPEKNRRQIWDRMNSTQKRLLGCSLAVFSGILYGFCFVPYLILSDTPEYSKDALDYVFAHFVGIYVASLFYFCIYAAIKKNQPILFPKVFLPAVTSGIMWAAACASWFVANQALGEVISFPIILASPPIIANLWTILVFREITKRKTLLILGAGFLVTCLGIIFIVLSKINK